MQIKRKEKKGRGRGEKKKKEIKDIEAIRWLDDKFHRFSETGQNKADKVIESVCTPGNPHSPRETMLKGRNERREKKVWDGVVVDSEVRRGMRRSWRGKECIERNGLTPVDGKGWCADCRMEP